MIYIALVFITISLASLWVKKTPWIWGILCGLSLIFAQKSGELTTKAFIPLAIVGILFWALQWDVKGLTRFVFVGTVLVLAGSIFSCLVPGFPKCFKLFYTQINYGKILIALPVLGWLVPLLSGKAAWIHFFTRFFSLSLIGAFLLISIAYYLHPPTISFLLLKNTSSMLTWTPLYLLCVIIPEEAFLRGFLQKEVFQWIGKGFVAHVITIVISSSIFSLFHLAWISDLSLLGLIFLAGCVYGTLYQITHVIETNILCRLITSCLYFCILSKEGFL
jgi:membrane protease YdiL (CAAX protease family)